MTRDSDWAIPAGALLVAQYLAALAVANHTSFAGRPPAASYMIVALVLSAGGGLVLLLRHLWALHREGENHPIARLGTETDFIAVGVYFLGFQLVALQISALTWLKEMLPLAVPYWADPALARIDRAILGVDAWRIIPDFLVRPLDALYPVWALVKFFTLFFVLALPASRFKAQAMVTYFLTVSCVGVFGQYALSSVGPIFYDRIVDTNDFASLAERTATLAPIANAAADYLWHSYLVPHSFIGDGISAMPSMHVATTTWAALALSRIWPKAAILFWMFWFIILLGSIGLGWHYLTDGIVGAGGAIACWRIAPALVALGSSFRDRISSQGTAVA